MMKRKLKTLFILITISLLGIVGLQVYWTINAYHVNKTRFDTDIDVAMQKAMDDCKKDYFDSIRVVLIKRLSDTGTKIKVDTIHEADTVHVILNIRISTKYASQQQPFNITTPQLAYYSRKINHKATLPEILTETSFYVPKLMQYLQFILGLSDISAHGKELMAYLKAHSNVPSDSLLAHNNVTPYGIYELPKKFREADSIKLNRYFNVELQKANIRANYKFYFSDKHTAPQKPNMHYSETAECSYEYHGFIFLGISPRGAQFFARAVFRNSQYAVLKSMLIPLCLAVLLILFTMYCFNYIVRLVIHQKKLAELKDDFINNMTHELKTPIATITVAIEALQRFNALNDAEKTQRYLQTSRAELSKLNNLVTKVLNIAAFENKNVELIIEKISVDEMINEIISSEKAKTTKDLNFSYINKDHIQWIYADRLHFGNVLNNIVDNAVKYSNEPISIVVTCFKDGDNVVFSVKDNGIGIPPAHINQVFDKFHRVPTGNIHNVKGTGLGLSYVKYIVNAHGGDIFVKSEINAGSEFIVSIPLNNG